MVDILGCVPLGSRLAVLEDIHQEARVRPGYVALTLLATPPPQRGCANSHSHQQQREVLIAPRLVTLGTLEFLNFC